MNFLICIVMAGDSGTVAYRNLSQEINQRYAQKHGYHFLYRENEALTDRAPQWIKIAVLIQLLSEKLPYTHFFWIDDDAFFNHHDLDLERFLRKYPDKKIILCSDDKNSGRKGSINTGTMFVENHPWCQSFLQNVWNYPSTHHLYQCCHEQTTMERLLQRQPSLWEHIAVEPETSFNSYYGQIQNQSLHYNFVIHLMATSPSFRFQYMRKWLSKHPPTIHHS